MFYAPPSPWGARPKVPVAQPACVPVIHFSTPSHAAWSRRELHRRSQWRSPHASAPLISAHPHTLCGSIGSSTESTSGAARMRPRHTFQHTLTRIVAPLGVPPKAAVAPACVPATHVGTASHVLWPHVAHSRSRPR
eukprot:6694649-Pyramimonas_sp.AAC.1